MMIDCSQNDFLVCADHSQEQPLATLSEQFDKMAKEQKLQMAKAKSGLNGKYKCDLCAVSCESEREYLHLHPT